MQQAGSDASGAARSEEGKFLTEDASGRALDFHCLRVSAVSAWVAAGAHPRVAQALARHAKVVLDDNAAFRHADWMRGRGAAHPESAERKAQAAGISYVKLEGSIGCLVNGEVEHISY